MDLLNEGPILCVHSKYRHWFHSSIIDGIQKWGKKLAWEAVKMFKTQPKLKKKKKKSGYLSFNFSSSFDLVYKYMEFNISCLKNKSVKMLMMVSWLLLTLQRDCHREKCLDAGVGRGWRLWSHIYVCKMTLKMNFNSGTDWQAFDSSHTKEILSSTPIGLGCLIC